MKNNSKFQKRSGAYHCNDCGKLTRETGGGESDCQLCAFCFEMAMLENGFSDGHITEDQYQTRKAELKIKYKR